MPVDSNLGTDEGSESERDVCWNLDNKPQRLRGQTTVYLST